MFKECKGLKEKLLEAERNAGLAFAAMEQSNAEVVKLKEEVATWKKKRTGTSSRMDPGLKRLLEDMQRIGKSSTLFLSG
jgi:hypothetical protein